MGFGQRGIRDEVKINRLPLRIPTRGLLSRFKRRIPLLPLYKGASNRGFLQIINSFNPKGKILMIPCRKMIPCRNMYSPLSLFSSALLLFSISSASVDTKPQTLVVDTFSVTKATEYPMDGGQAEMISPCFLSNRKSELFHQNLHQRRMHQPRTLQVLSTAIPASFLEMENQPAPRWRQ